MAREKIPAAPAAERAEGPVHPPPTRGGAFERTPSGDLRPIEESAEREKLATEPGAAFSEPTPEPNKTNEE